MVSDLPELGLEQARGQLAIVTRNHRHQPGLAVHDGDLTGIGLISACRRQRKRATEALSQSLRFHLLDDGE